MVSLDQPCREHWLALEIQDGHWGLRENKDQPPDKQTALEVQTDYRRQGLAGVHWDLHVEVRGDKQGMYSSGAATCQGILHEIHAAARDIYDKDVSKD